MLNVAGRSLAMKLCLLVLGTVACGADMSGQPLDASTAKLAEEARSLSLRWLADAEDAAESDEIRDAIADVEGLLSERALMAPPKAYESTCDAGSKNTFIAAFVTGENNSDIYICDQSKKTGKVFLAQVLIHEALHLRGESDECAVTRLELIVMTNAFRMPYRNAYVERCGLEELANELSDQVQAAHEAAEEEEEEVAGRGR
jgi:hypothetical protein